MLKRFYPKYYLNNIFEITSDFLNDINVKSIIFDIDNTLAPHYVPEPDEKTIEHFKALKDNGIKIGILSNNSRKRVEIFNSKLNVPAIYRASKPGITKIKMLVKELGFENKETAIAGDQVFTDVWCGNKAGLITILVKPVTVKDEWIVKLKRGLESLIIKSYLRKAGK